MRIETENEYSAESIKADLERLYAAASYLNADGRDLNLVTNLLAAAVAELESITARNPPVSLSLVHDSE